MDPERKLAKFLEQPEQKAPTLFLSRREAQELHTRLVNLEAQKRRIAGAMKSWRTRTSSLLAMLGEGES